MPQSRGDIVANLDAQSFLAELSSEMEEERRQSHKPSPIELPEDAEGTREYMMEDSPEPLDNDQIEDAMVTEDLCSSPVTPRPQAPIEFYVTPKSLYQNPPYHHGVVALFLNKTNAWVRKASRPTALDMWELSDCGPHDATLTADTEIAGNIDKRLMVNTDEATIGAIDDGAMELEEASSVVGHSNSAITDDDPFTSKEDALDDAMDENPSTVPPKDKDSASIVKEEIQDIVSNAAPLQTTNQVSSDNKPEVDVTPEYRRLPWGLSDGVGARLAKTASRRQRQFGRYKSFSGCPI